MVANWDPVPYEAVPILCGCTAASRTWRVWDDTIHWLLDCRCDNVNDKKKKHVAQRKGACSRRKDQSKKRHALSWNTFASVQDTEDASVSRGAKSA